jgi:hypothetical protein
MVVFKGRRVCVCGCLCFRSLLTLVPLSSLNEMTRSSPTLFEKKNVKEKKKNPFISSMII